jgi:hypothetical protein
MSTPVADRSSNKNEQIVHAAEVIGRSAHRRRIFTEIYTGKAKIKTVPFLMKRTGLPRTRVLDAGKALSQADIVTQIKVNGVTAYEKIDFIQPLRARILRAKDPRKRDAIPTKRNSSGAGAKSTLKITTTVRIQKKRNKATLVTVDDFDSFKKVRPVPHGLDYVKMGETAFKTGVSRILGERGPFNDWGGEQRDLSSSHVRLNGHRRVTAIAFKGPGTSGRLTPGKMGKNGDQIQRLVRCPAEVFLVQYWGGIDDAVLEQLQDLVRLKAYFEDRSLWYGIIDGDDSARLIQAYPADFSAMGRRKAPRKKR